jgi:hypothetical protein
LLKVALKQKKQTKITRQIWQADRWNSGFG